VVLSAATNNVLTGWRTLVKFGAADSAVSSAAYVTSDQREEFVAMSARTFGVDDPGTVEEFRQGTGAFQRLSPCRAGGDQRIMYHPPDLGTNDNVRDEFIELHNISTAPVELYDPPTRPMSGTCATRWTSTSRPDRLPAGGYLLVVSFDPVNNPSVLATFRARYQIDPTCRSSAHIAASWANDSEDLELKKPGHPDHQRGALHPGRAHPLRRRLPWPEGAEWRRVPRCKRVQRTIVRQRPRNWTAASPTPGRKRRRWTATATACPMPGRTPTASTPSIRPMPPWTPSRWPDTCRISGRHESHAYRAERCSRLTRFCACVFSVFLRHYLMFLFVAFFSLFLSVLVCRIISYCISLFILGR